MKEQTKPNIEPNHELIMYFLSNSTLIDRVQLITILSPDIYIPTPRVHKDGTKYMDCIELDSETPCCPNGLSIQLQTTDFAEHK